MVPFALVPFLVLAACGTSATGSTATSQDSSTAAVVHPPDFTLQGCTYVFDGTVPPEEPQGVKPDYPSFEPDPSARSALESIDRHGGNALLNGFSLFGGADLYAGPDASGTRVGTVPQNYAILVAEPVLWTDSAGDTWIAFYISCGGENLYWVSLDQLKRGDPNGAAEVTGMIDQARQSHPSGISPIIVKDGQLAWKDPSVTYIIGRGEQYGPVS